VSALARDLASAEAATGGAGELRFDLVSRLRAEVRGGSYRLDAQALARAMVERGEQA
jgi:anti-sigma28 factor (negative regulator of flagellin synthesis)